MVRLQVAMLRLLGWTFPMITYVWILDRFVCVSFSDVECRDTNYDDSIKDYHCLFKTLSARFSANLDSKVVFVFFPNKPHASWRCRAQNIRHILHDCLFICFLSFVLFFLENIWSKNVCSGQIIDCSFYCVIVFLNID